MQVTPSISLRISLEIKDLLASASSRMGDSYTVSPTSSSASTSVSREQSLDPIKYAEDDMAVRTQSFIRVDYLSHNWKEEDLWSSWKHIVSKRTAYRNSARLENASWRTWMKLKHKLKTVSPESLNWLKDSDVTWLYGPLQAGSDGPLTKPSSSPASRSDIPNSNSILNKKPILRKQSFSEIILQRSFSISSLFEQAVLAIQDHQSSEAGRRCDRPSMGQATSACASFPFSSRRESGEAPTLHHSILSLGSASSGLGEQKHIHFNEQVEQYIALETNGDDNGELDSSVIDDYEDSDSDDGGLMMKTIHSKQKLPLMSSRRAAQGNFSVDNKTIAMLPSTTLKYGEITPEPVETAMEHSNGFRNNSKFSPSICTLPGKDFKNDDAIMNWQTTGAFANIKESMAVTQQRPQNLYTCGSSSSLNCDPLDSRRAPLDMFISNERDKSEVAPEGPFEKIVDMVNTAKDIAYVIWNADRKGWSL